MSPVLWGALTALAFGTSSFMARIVGRAIGPLPSILGNFTIGAVVVVLWFVYASCLDVCPLHSEKIAEIQRMVNKTPMKDLVSFIAITTDPKRDTPQELQDYGPAHGLEPANWTFLTDGQDKPETTRNLAESYGLKFTPTRDGYQMHGLVTHLIDKSGNLRGRYHGLKFSATNMVLHINALTNDFH